MSSFFVHHVASSRFLFFHSRRIRGRGANARKTTAAAGIHATAAAVAYFLRSHGTSNGLAADEDADDNTAVILTGASSGNLVGRKSGGGKEAESETCHAKPPAPFSPLRVLVVLDCPSLPPLAMLEAVAIEGGAGLEKVAVGSSKPFISAESDGGTKRRGEARVSDVGAVVGRENVDRSAEFRGDDADDEGGLGRRGVVEVGGGGVTLASETLKALHVSGEAALTRVALRCPRLERVDFVGCPLLG